MKVLVTGASGMLGADLMKELSSKFDVLGTGRSAAPFPNYRKADLTIASGVASLFSFFKPDVVFHTAAMTQVDDCETQCETALNANFEAAKNVADAASKAAALLVHFSTDYVFAGDGQGEVLENAPRGPREKISYYGETKRLAEEYIEKNSQNYIIFRVAWLYGIHGKRSFPRAILDRAKSQKEFDVVYDQTGRPTFTKDLAAAMAQLLASGVLKFEKNRNAVYHLGNTGRSVSWADFAECILSEAGFTGWKIKRITSEELNRPAKRPKNSVLSLEKAKRVLGIELRPWENAVSEFINEYKKQDAAA